MASFTSFRAAPCAAPCARRSAVRVPRTVVRAEDPKFTLDNSRQSAEGYVEKDTAGQSNMYPTVIKPFEAGGAADTVNQDGFNNTLAVGSSVLALALIGGGLTVLVGTGGAPAPEVLEETSYASLSEYSARFSKQLAPKAAPAVVAAAVEESQ